VDADPQPGEDGYFESLQVRLRACEAHLLTFGSLDGERVETQVARCVANQELQEIKQLIADERVSRLQAEAGSSKLIELYMKESNRCTKSALEWSTQQTRAIKYAIADELADLEAKLEAHGTKQANLKAV
jgi:hypothetical protein